MKQLKKNKILTYPKITVRKFVKNYHTLFLWSCRITGDAGLWNSAFWRCDLYLRQIGIACTTTRVD